MRLNGPMIMAGGLVAGLAVPPAAALISPGIAPLMAVILLLTAMRTDTAILWRYVRRPALPFLAMAIVYGLVPLAVLLALPFLPLPADLAQAIALNSATPPILGAPALAMLLTWDFELALVGMVGCTLAAPLTITLAYGLSASGTALPDWHSILVRVLLLTLAPVAAGLTLRSLLGRDRLDRHGGLLQSAIVWALTVIAVGLMHGANLALARDPWEAAGVLVAALGFSITMQTVVALLFRRLGLARAGILAVLAGSRNLGLTQAGLGAQASDVFMAYVALGQVPIYLGPMVWQAIKRTLDQRRS